MAQQYEGLCVGGVADGQRMVNDHHILEAHSLPEVETRAVGIYSSQIQVVRDTYAHHVYNGLGVWIPVNDPIISQDEMFELLYEGYRRKAWAKPKPVEKKSVLKVKFKTKTKQPEEECNVPF